MKATIKGIIVEGNSEEILEFVSMYKPKFSEGGYTKNSEAIIIPELPDFLNVGDKPPRPVANCTKPGHMHNAKDCPECRG